MNDGIESNRWLTTVWQRRYTIVIVTVAFLVVAALLGFWRPVYESHAVIQLSNRSASAYATPPSAAHVLSSRTFLETVVATTSIPVSTQELYMLARADPVRDTQMVRLSVRYRSAEGARDLANAMARAFISKASEQVQQRREATRVRLEAVDAQLAELQRIQRSSWPKLFRQQPGTTIQGEELTLNRTLILASLYKELSDVRKDLVAELYALELPAFIETPFVPPQSHLRRAANIGLTAILGLMAGTALAFVLEAFGPLTSASIRPRSVATDPDPRRSKEFVG